jgi:hypothetical protein
MIKVQNFVRAFVEENPRCRRYARNCDALTSDFSYHFFDTTFLPHCWTIAGLVALPSYYSNRLQYFMKTFQLVHWHGEAWTMLFV